MKLKLLEQFLIDDYEVIKEACDLAVQRYEERKEQEGTLGHITSRDRYAKKISRAVMVRAWADQEICHIRGMKFEHYRTTKRYWRGVLGNSNKLKVEI
jgi:hypothetical protein